MTAAHIAFWGVGLLTSVSLAAAFYPGVRRRAKSARDSAIAAGMAALLCGATAALAASFLVHAAAELMR